MIGPAVVAVLIVVAVLRSQLVRQLLAAALGVTAGAAVLAGYGPVLLLMVAGVAAAGAGLIVLLHGYVVPVAPARARAVIA